MRTANSRFQLKKFFPKSYGEKVFKVAMMMIR